MTFDIDQIKKDYTTSKGNRELNKWIFAVATLGLGGLYLWANTKIIPEGNIGLRKTASGKMVLLPPGRHSNFPWESYPEKDQSLSKKIITMGPHKIITVQTGYVAKTSKNGVLTILTEGQHLISDASHTYDGMISIKQETKKLDPITVSTKDNVGLTMQADVRYQIIDPTLAITHIDDIEESIKQIAEMSMYQTVGSHSLEDFAPATLVIHSPDHENTGIMAVVLDLKAKLTEQLQKIGISLLNIGITNREFIDESLAHELAQGAVIKSQADSQRAAAENAAVVKETQTKAEANTIITIAKAQAEAVKEKGQAILDLARLIETHPVAQAMYQRSQEIELVQFAKNANLFFQARGQDAILNSGITLTHSAS